MLIHRYDNASDVARLLIASPHVAFSDDPAGFSFTSGRVSPVYVNMRGFVGEARLRDALLSHAERYLREIRNSEGFDVVAGGETAGIPYAAILADRLGVDFCYVRKAKKGFGQNKLVEGANIAMRSAVLVEDLTTDGQSKVAFVNGMREVGGLVSNVLSMFYYGFDQSITVLFGRAGIALWYLCSWSDILNLEESRERLTGAQRDRVMQFLRE